MLCFLLSAKKLFEQLLSNSCLNSKIPLSEAGWSPNIWASFWHVSPSKMENLVEFFWSMKQTTTRQIDFLMVFANNKNAPIHQFHRFVSKISQATKSRMLGCRLPGRGAEIDLRWHFGGVNFMRRMEIPWLCHKVSKKWLFVCFAYARFLPHAVSNVICVTHFEARMIDALTNCTVPSWCCDVQVKRVTYTSERIASENVGYVHLHFWSSYV